MEGKRCESIIHDHDRDLLVTMVGWVDVLHSDWGDLRRQHAVNISSYTYNILLTAQHDDRTQSFEHQRALHGSDFSIVNILDKSDLVIIGSHCMLHFRTALMPWKIFLNSL